MDAGLIPVFGKLSFRCRGFLSFVLGDEPRVVHMDVIRKDELTEVMALTV